MQNHNIDFRLTKNRLTIQTMTNCEQLPIKNVNRNQKCFWEKRLNNEREK